MFNQITLWDNVVAAYNKTQKGKPKYKIPAVRFSQNETTNLRQIQQSVVNKTYSPIGYYRFEIEEPKPRIIYAPAYEDKIVHHMLYAVLRDFYEPKFIFDSYSCIRNKGNQRAVKRIQTFLQQANRTWGDVYVAKLDVSKFFPSIDRELLKTILARKIICQDTLWLCYTIIDSSPTERGLPLGCVTSQLFANIYLNEIDHYIKRELKVKYYVRYADDLFLFVRTKQDAESALVSVSSLLEDKLNLSCSERKRYSKNTSNGVDGLGYKIFKTHILLKSASKKRVLCRLKSFPSLVRSSAETNRSLSQALNSWLAYARVAKVEQFIKSMESQFGWLHIANGKFEVLIEDTL